MNIISRKDAKALGLKRYFTNNLCPNEHIAQRYTSGGNCVECLQHRLRRPYFANPERIKTYSRAWRKSNLEKSNAYSFMWRKKNPEKRRAVQAAWRKANLDKVAAYAMHYHTSKYRAMPIWARKQSIENIYAKAKLLTITTGIKHQVDHIYPIKSMLVCGLHVEHNLQILTATENKSKGNRVYDGVHFEEIT